MRLGGTRAPRAEGVPRRLRRSKRAEREMAIRNRAVRVPFAGAMARPRVLLYPSYLLFQRGAICTSRLMIVRKATISPVSVEEAQTISAFIGQPVSTGAITPLRTTISLNSKGKALLL